jgi:putative ABC transport system permease protein
LLHRLGLDRHKITLLAGRWKSKRNRAAGVIQDVKLTGLDAPAQPEVYRPDSQEGDWMFSLVVRSTLPPASLATLVRREVLAVDKDLPVYNPRTMEESIANSGAARRFTGLLIGLFAALALVLTAVGIYGVVSYAVSQRTREMGIRMALGAQRGDVLWLVIAREMKLALAGAAIGLVAALALARFMAGLLFEIQPGDSLTFVSVSLSLLAIALAACWLPAARAARVDPMVALRTE